MTDAVRNVGGWMFDRVMAGWDVTVLISGAEDVRPLQILGANVLELERSLGSQGHGPMPHAIAVSGDLFEADARVRRGVLDALEHGTAEVLVWGDNCPVELDARIGSVQHRLSVAARAFKAQALTAAAISAPALGGTEVFRGGVPLTQLASVRDLVPIG
ncbi:hypothetical protein NRB56_68520 [Nocardia sp. RB56]|uniref:Uncharacterized protein n=2 Tax=Nocardia aurantia TaxID=2585199 RepID=A0A7K0DZK4_9NOCA|nr:hypothetical protein [Nocardia aurantia]